MKYIKILLFLFLISCQENNSENNKSRSITNDKLKAAINKLDIKPRGTLIEISSAKYRLDYYDGDEKDSHRNFLESRGYQAGGPSWLGIIYGAIKLSDPAMLNKIQFDDEADGIAVWSSDKEVLMKISRLIAVVKTDEKVLEQVIQVAEEDNQME